MWVPTWMFNSHLKLNTPKLSFSDFLPQPCSFHSFPILDKGNFILSYAQAKAFRTTIDLTLTPHVWTICIFLALPSKYSRLSIHHVLSFLSQPPSSHCYCNSYLTLPASNSQSIFVELHLNSNTPLLGSTLSPLRNATLIWKQLEPLYRLWSFRS